ncbi:PIN domain-containing protein [Curtobacterium sp. TXMA1]|uniref:PIN domain-containing protein n=1 Tax=Curtobacterium sp. TXMA1 TaxID=2876939 RepID=UPI001CCCAA4C|nr:PIN domain-containing protein [Curtobacterium sp. TXMA1]UBQ02022.1 VapC toxin family PIN domain ribonuclease [Curtobacterium sp. TXMA1]
MSAYIVDNSVWWKAGRCPSIAARLRVVATQDLILTCPPQVLEYCSSARVSAEHAALAEDMAAFLPADVVPAVDAALEIQQSLWHRGYVRGAGVVDVLVAAYAVTNDAVVLTADHDYDHIAAVMPRFRHEYLPEG